MEYGIWTLIPVLFVIAFALKTKRTLEPLIFGTLLTYVITSAARIPSEGVYALSHIATDWMDAFFRVATDYSHQWVFLVRVVRQPHYAVGRIPWNTGIYKGAWKALPGAKVHHDGHLDHGDSYFCG